jgi:amidase
MTYPGSKEADVDLRRKTPAGSSSGSAVAIAAGFSPLTIGTESNGSIVQPAIRAAAYGLKGTVDDVIMKGTQSGGAAFDSAGPIAKSAEDCADVMDILLPGRDFCSHLTKSWNGIRIAYLDYKTWQFPDSMCEKTPDFDTQHVSIRSLSSTATDSL